MNPKTERIDKILRRYYGHEIGMDQSIAIKDMLNDLRQLCVVTNRKLDVLLSDARNELPIHGDKEYY